MILLDKDEKILVACVVLGSTALGFLWLTKDRWLPYAEQKFSEFKLLKKVQKANPNPGWGVYR
mgnify:CR=1 FL=1